MMLPSRKSSASLRALQRDKSREKLPEAFNDNSLAARVSNIPRVQTVNQYDSESDASSVVSESVSNADSTAETDNKIRQGSPGISPRQPKKRGHLSTFAKHISMTPYKGGKLFKSGSSTSVNKKTVQKTNAELYQEAVREAHRRDFERWVLTKKDNLNKKFNDPLLNSSTRLNVFMDFFDSLLKGEHISDRQHKEDHLSFYAVSSLKFVSGVDQLVTDSVLTEFTNYDMKEKEKMRILKTNNDFFGIQFSWQFAIDNPNADVYNYSTTPIIYTIGASDYLKTHIGPANFHVVNGKSITNLPFSSACFSFCLDYNMFYDLPKNQWLPVLREYHRVLLPKGSLNIFLIDFEAVNSKNEGLKTFFAKVREVFERKGIDPYPCKHIMGHLKEAGFKRVRYSMISLKRGLNNQLGNMFDFLIGYVEYLLYEKLASVELDDEILAAYRDLKLQYHQDLRNGKLVDDIGDAYCMLVFAKKE